MMTKKHPAIKSVAGITNNAFNNRVKSIKDNNTMLYKKSNVTQEDEYYEKHKEEIKKELDRIFGEGRNSNG